MNRRSTEGLTYFGKIGDAYHEQGIRLLLDYKQFYWSENMAYVGLAVLIAAPLANTNADQQFRNWYQKQAKGNSGVDSFALQVKNLGEYKYMVPAYIGISIAGHLFPDNIYATPVGEFGDRSLRALAVGAPMVGVLQYGLGGARPYTGGSQWDPLKATNSASGHAFVGAVPFLTAAEMTDNWALKAVFVGGSFLTGWSRIHTDDHYISQVFLGWSMAYLATTTVSHTNRERRVRIVPMETATGMGLGMQVRY